MVTATSCSAITAVAALASGGGAHSAGRELPRKPHPLAVSDWNWTHWSPNARRSSHAGSVNAGPAYFYCWTTDEPFTRGDDLSDKWVDTMDVQRDKDVYISVLHTQYHDTGDLPEC